MSAETKSKDKRACSHCRNALSSVPPTCCQHCYKSLYCSQECLINGQKGHAPRCVPVTKLRIRLVGSGYNDRLGRSSWAVSQLLEHGKRYLDSRRRGFLGFSVFPMSELPMIEKQLASTKTSAIYFQDPTSNQLFHVFIVPFREGKYDRSAPIELGIDPNFITFCEDPSIYRYYMPMMLMNTETVIDETNLTTYREVSKIAYYATGLDE